MVEIRIRKIPNTQFVTSSLSKTRETLLRYQQKLDMVVHTCYPHTQKIEAGRLWVWSQLGLLSETCLIKRTSGIQAFLAFASGTTVVNIWSLKKLVSALYIYIHKRSCIYIKTKLINFELFFLKYHYFDTIHRDVITAFYSMNSILEQFYVHIKTEQLSRSYIDFPYPPPNAKSPPLSTSCTRGYLCNNWWIYIDT